MVALRALRATRFGSADQPFEPSRVASFLSPGDAYLAVHGSDSDEPTATENIAQITQPSGAKDDRSKYVRYARAASLITQWRANGTLGTSETPSLYVHKHTVERNGATFTRTSLIGLMRVDAPELVLSEGVGFQDREDRLRMLEATRFHADPIVAVGAQSQAIQSLLEDLGAPLLHVTTEGGETHELFAIADTPVAFDRLLVIEGSHRLVAARVYQEDARERLSGRRRRGLEPAAPESGNDEIAEDYALVEVVLEDESVFLRRSTLLVKTKLGENALVTVSQAIQDEAGELDSPVKVSAPGSGIIVLKTRSEIEQETDPVRTKSLPVSVAGHFMLERALNPLEVEITRSLADAPKQSAENLPNGQLLIEIEGGKGELMKKQVEPMGTLPTGTLALDPPATSGLVTWHFADFR